MLRIGALADFEIERCVRLGDWIRAEIEKDAFFEQNGFLPDRVRRSPSGSRSSSPRQRAEPRPLTILCRRPNTRVYY
jgi:hypothetical protein